MGAYEAELTRVWRETECAGEPSDAEVWQACLHGRACARAWRRATERGPMTEREVEDMARSLGCNGCPEYEGEI